MKDFLAHQLRTFADPKQRKNVMREYLQARILAALQRAGAMMPLAFHGGTALRFLYASARYSEDLDFTLEGARTGYDLRGWLQTIRSELGGEGYRIGIKISDTRAVHNAFLRFRGLLHEFDLSPHPGEALSVKLEVDTRPPAGVVLTSSVLRRYVPLRLQHHDRASLLAGKLHAILQRAYTKGRDIYDLFWYLSDPGWPAPNLVLLNNALTQTHWGGEPVTADNWRTIVAKRLQDLTWERVVGDVRPFLERQHEAELLTPDNLQQLLSVHKS